MHGSRGVVVLGRLPAVRSSAQLEPNLYPIPTLAWTPIPQVLQHCPRRLQAHLWRWALLAQAPTARTASCRDRAVPHPELHERPADPAAALQGRQVTWKADLQAPGEHGRGHGAQSVGRKQRKLGCIGCSCERNRLGALAGETAHTTPWLAPHSSTLLPRHALFLTTAIHMEEALVLLQAHAHDHHRTAGPHTRAVVAWSCSSKQETCSGKQGKRMLGVCAATAAGVK